jgi:UDP-N-acetylglucosamine diphosphorylase/glucosamine-1-phosphate N-acetyltransferase
VRQYLASLVKEENPGAEINQISSDRRSPAGKACLLINGRCIMNRKLASVLRKSTSDVLFTTGGDIIGVRLSGDNLAKSQTRLYGDSVDFSELEGLPKVEVEANLVRYPWDLVYANESELINDFLLLTRNRKSILKAGKIHKSAALIGRKNVHVGRQSIVGAGVVLDAEAGPIYIGRNVRIFPNAAIEGPCFVGDGSSIKIGASIYGNTTIGPVCKVGGEVEHSIFHSHANKQHHGFLGHSYLSPWVNLGAGTTTSNLKNTYGSVKVHIDGRLVDSEKMFVGLTAGDHAKMGINATLDTGTVIGPSSNIYGSAIPSKFVPSFSWGGAEHLITYQVEKALSVAITVMRRRNIEASRAYQNLFRHVFSITQHERVNFST